MKKYIMVRISASMFKDTEFVTDFTKGHIRQVVNKECKFGWVGNVVLQEGFSEDSFIKNIKLLIIHFDYIPTPRIFRNPAKKKRIFLNRYL